MAFSFRPLGIPGLVLVETRRFEDPRGFFRMTHRQSVFSENGIPDRFVQANLSHSARGTLRGLHYQKPPRAQGKLLAVLRGEVYDVAVDLRRGSTSFGTWEAVTLSAENGRMLWVPPGFAHGFCVTSEEADVLYQVTEEYAPEAEAGIRFDDPELAIPWPVARPVLSEKDRRLPGLRAAQHPF